MEVAATWPPKTFPRPFWFLPPAGLFSRRAPEFYQKWPTGSGVELTAGKRWIN
jgi:hypothetical protein